MLENSGNYLAQLSQSAVTEGTLSPEDVRRIQGSLWQLLAKRTARFNMGDSSSVPVETAQELLKSICFCIGIQLKSEASRSSAVLDIKSGDMQGLFEQGLGKIVLLIEEGKILLDVALKGALQIENISYHDSLKELTEFFKNYDHRFLAHVITCMIDYQQCIPVSSDLLGIEYINEYLRRFIIENTFCGKFDTNTIISLLSAYSQ